jgi:DNA-directed RNA polymerase subunit RPC12/RpoP
MTNRCPDCGSRDLKISTRKGIGEYVRGLFGYYPVRCANCKSRFEVSIFSKRLMRYAHCPRCLRTDLSRWNLEHYIVPFGTRFKLNLGAQPFRCETCRCNFASFRPRRERFSWRKHRERGLLSSAQSRGLIPDGKPEHEKAPEPPPPDDTQATNSQTQETVEPVSK